MDIGVITIVVQLIFLEGILSIDNAAVLGAMVRHLPNDKPIPWPRWLGFLSKGGDRIFGHQQQAALKVGLLGAYVGRAIMLVLAEIVIDIPWLRVVGALYLLYLALHHFSDLHHESLSEEAKLAQTLAPTKGGFWITVASLELADLAFSIDNVIAAVALSNRLWVVMLGVAIGIVVMRFAATLFTRLIAWEPALETGAYLLLVAIGTELIAEQVWNLHLEEWQQFAISAGLLVLTVVVARTPLLRKVVGTVMRPVLALLAFVHRGFTALRQVVMLPFQRKPAHHLGPHDEA